MLALIGVDLPQREARLVERRRLLEGVRQQRRCLVAGAAGHEAADEELEGRDRRAGGQAAALRRRRALGTRRRPRRAATSKRSARGPRSTISAAMCPVSTRIVRARSTSSPAVASTRPTIAADGADDAGQPDDGGVTQERHARHAQPFHRPQAIVARDRRHARGAQLAREGDGGQLAEPFRLAARPTTAWNGITSGRGRVAGRLRLHGRRRGQRGPDARSAARRRARPRVTARCPSGRDAPARSRSAARRWHGSRRSPRARRGRTAS